MKDQTNILLDGFARRNAPLAPRTRALFANLVGDRPQHARLLNTLAMLEHLGSHKIMATQHGGAIDQFTLKHLAEEARHAFFFKRQAEREAGRSLSGDAADLFAPATARGYFGRLEVAVARALPDGADPRAAYLIMSLIIEFRAVWAYEIYAAVLAQAGHGLSLKSLLAEEAGHLTDMCVRLDAIGQFDPGRIEALTHIEQALYQRLLGALEAETSAASMAA